MFSLSRFSRGGKFFSQEFKVKASSFVAWAALAGVGKTMRFHTEGEEHLERAQEKKQAAILASWHGRMFAAIYYLRNRSICGIVSPSRDGEYFGALFSRFGWNLVRGSSRRMGVSALKGAISVLRDGNVLAVTPDGPIGPKGKAHPGVVYLAAHLQVPVIPVGVSCCPCKTLGTWDESMLPVPFGKACVIFDAPYFIPENAKDDIGRHVSELEQRINAVIARADSYFKQQGTGNREQ